jgi:hypothetical protein
MHNVKLKDALLQLDDVNREMLICAKRPWTEDADCVVVAPDDRLGVPTKIEKAGYEYVIDVPTAKEVLEVFGDRVPTETERVVLILHYAEHDAYPDWVYDA